MTPCRPWACPHEAADSPLAYTRQLDGALGISWWPVAAPQWARETSWVPRLMGERWSPCGRMAEMQHHLEAAIAVEGAFTHRMQRRELAKVLVDLKGWACSGKEC